MNALLSAPRKPIIAAISIITALIVLFRFYGDVPVDVYRNYAPGESILPATTQNDKPQPGYFKAQPEWDWKVPDFAGWKGYARNPRNRDIIVLTASDGGGHNSAIPNVLERVLDDREKYCARHGYTNLWLNTSRYDIGEAHRTWSKIPAVAEAFSLYPSAEWVWLIDTDIIMMEPDYDLVKEIVGPDAIKRGLMRDTPILDGQLKKNPTNINTPKNFRVEDIDILITQDHQSVNTGSTFFRRSAFTRWTLEMMTDYTMLMGQDHVGAEQDAIKHLMLEHQLVRNHVGIYPQRKFNAYVQGGDNMGYRDGDLLVHFAGCWVGGKCQEWFEEFWGKKGHKDVWRPETGNA
ncbi:glycosyltransferase family 34 protein [Macroventuria anomochaeta]|uniref:Glycosyltransferase family 34 protein n=1 Tax=Macroventuria anomochaeta TaxID=301207 RepID=A0ACB6SFQ0_9PLEO|nr:glycosyltransferase family 34 protein [Macroventuria anomochaeta]KAF2632807.1 glycosyltransferase family 34 protein [Macroventuria anomochaeta]